MVHAKTDDLAELLYCHTDDADSGLFGMFADNLEDERLRHDRHGESPDRLAGQSPLAVWLSCSSSPH